MSIAISLLGVWIGLNLAVAVVLTLRTSPHVRRSSERRRYFYSLYEGARY